MFQVGKPIWIKKSFTSDGKDYVIELAVRPPRMEIQRSLEKAIRHLGIMPTVDEGEAEDKAREMNEDERDKLMNYLEAVQDIIPPEVAAAHLKDWKGIAGEDGEALPYSEEVAVSAFIAEPTLYALTVEAIQESSPRRKETEEKNL
jgi:hypothetical protein